jgi:hypothetical protein
MFDLINLSSILAGFIGAIIGAECGVFLGTFASIVVAAIINVLNKILHERAANLNSSLLLDSIVEALEKSSCSQIWYCINDLQERHQQWLLESKPEHEIITLLVISWIEIMWGIILIRWIEFQEQRRTAK